MYIYIYMYHRYSKRVQCSAYPGDSCIFLIFDRFDLDLRRYLRRHGAFHGDQLRQCSRQLFSGAGASIQKMELIDEQKI